MDGKQWEQKTTAGGTAGWNEDLNSWIKAFGSGDMPAALDKTWAFSFFRQTQQGAGHRGLMEGIGKFATHHVNTRSPRKEISLFFGLLD